MSNEELAAAVLELAGAMRAQTEMQEQLAASNRALTEMLGHTIDAVNALSDRMEDTPPPDLDLGDDIQF